MSVEQAIHEHWGAYKPLADLVSDANVFTGEAKGELTLPYVTLERIGDTESRRTSEGTILETVQLRFNVWGETLDQVKKVGDAISDHFNRLDFDWSRGKVCDCKPNNQVDVPDTNGVWHSLRDYLVRVRHNSRTRAA